MSIGPDRVQVVKRESSAGGGDPAEDSDFLTTLDPLEDVLEAAGFYCQAPSETRDETVYLERHNGKWRYKDASVSSPTELGTPTTFRRHFLLMGA